MSSQITKLGLMSLISSAAAIPFHGHGHQARHFHPSGKPSGYPGAPYGFNSTGPYGPTGTGLATGSFTSTNTFTETIYSTETDYKTVYMKSTAAAASGSAVAAEFSSGCAAGPQTIYVTATNKVTVTVTPGASSSSAAAVGSSYAVSSAVESSVAAVSSAVSSAVESAAASSAAGYGSYVLPSSSVVAAEESSSISLVNHGYGSSSIEAAATSAKSSAAAAYTPAPYSSQAVESSAAPASSVVYSSAVASSSAQASSTSTASTGGKRGLPYNDASLTQCLTGGKVSWAYNWGQTAGEGLASDLEFFPMLWGTGDDFTGTWEENWKAALSSGTTTFLGFNEPDLPAQANLSPEAAASAWKTYMEPIKTANSGVTLVSPAVTNGADGMGIDWLVSFQEACSDCNIDHVAIHWYESASNVQYFKDHATEAHQKTGKPVWISEFGCTNSSDDEINDFLTEVMAWMDEQDWIMKYAYFMASSGLLVSGTEPSTYGKTYASA